MSRARSRGSSLERNDKRNAQAIPMERCVSHLTNEFELYKWKMENECDQYNNICIFQHKTYFQWYKISSNRGAALVVDNS